MVAKAGQPDEEERIARCIDCGSEQYIDQVAPEHAFAQCAGNCGQWVCEGCASWLPMEPKDLGPFCRRCAIIACEIFYEDDEEEEGDEAEEE